MSKTLFLRMALNLLIITGSPVYASQQEITQPIGELVRIWGTTGNPPLPLQPPSLMPPFSTPTTPVEEVNYICAQWDFNVSPQSVPFDLNTAVTEIVLTQPQHFVRLYSPESGSSPNGPWIMRSEYVRGLTPEQLKDRFALPTLPTYIVNVDLPASPDPATGKDYALWTGIAGPIVGFGNGGAVQNRIIADFHGTNYFPNYEFVVGTRNHPQPIGNFALSYQPMAGKGNTHHIAAYLDQFVPRAYSDLEKVYTILDFLNWIGFGPDPIQQALNQIGPQDYNAITFVVTRNALLFGNAILERCNLFRENSCCDPCCQDNCNTTNGSSGGLTFQAVGEYMNEKREQHQVGFNDWTGGGVITYDCQPQNNLILGMSVAGLDNYLKWHEDRGSAHIAGAKLGLYSSYCPCIPCLPIDLYIDGLVTGGYNWTKARRSIQFPGVNREARSRQTGYDVAVHVQGGFDVPLCRWQISPLARISYFYVRENGFTERGADSLDLNVRGFDAQTLRTQLGIGVCRSFDWACAEIIPRINVAWINDLFLDNRVIRSSLRHLGRSFSVHGFNRDRNGFLGEVSLMVRNANGLGLEGSYDIETEDRFIAQRFKLCLDWCF
jgi:hypothetical protein